MGGKGKKPTYQKKPFESTGVSSDVSGNIYESMLTSAAYKELTSSQKALYIACKAQYYAEKRKPDNDKTCFTMNQGKWSGKYGLYKVSNAAGFYRDMEALILHGFVDCVCSGAMSRSKSIYRYSDRWQKYGTKEFDTPARVMTLGMLRKRK